MYIFYSLILYQQFFYCFDIHFLYFFKLFIFHNPCIEIMVSGLSQIREVTDESHCIFYEIKLNFWPAILVNIGKTMGYRIHKVGYIDGLSGDGPPAEKFVVGIDHGLLMN